MRRHTRGLLLPGVALTLLALLGVAAVFSAGLPALPDHLTGFRVGAQDHGGGSIHVPVVPTPKSSGSPTPSASPSTVIRTTPPATPTPTSEPSTVRPTQRPPTTPPGSKRPTQPPPKPPVTTAKACKAGSAVLAANADAYVDQSSPGKNFGDAQNLLVASRDKSRNRRALIRFALPSLPAGCSLRSATLTMAAKEPTQRRLLVARANRGWNEGAVTWATAPAPAGAAVAATVSGSRVSWTVTSQVAAMRSGGNYGFVIRDSSESSRTEVPQTNLAGLDASKGAPTLTIRWG